MDIVPEEIFRPRPGNNSPRTSLQATTHNTKVVNIMFQHYIASSINIQKADTLILMNVLNISMYIFYI